MATAQPLTLGGAGVAVAMGRYDSVLLDCDGVLWGSNHVTVLPGIGEAVDRLRSMGKKLIFVTNNSEYSRRDLADKIRSLAGFEPRECELFPVAYCAALYLKHIAKIQGKCYVIGGEAMAKELTDVGVENFGSGVDSTPISSDPMELLAISKTLDADVKAVLLGYDTHFNYAKQFKVCSFLLDSECLFLACNEREEGFRLGPRCWRPGAGTIVPCISMATKQKPVFLGKPYERMLDCIKLKVPQLDMKRTVMIGDSLKTDILFAGNCGIDSIMVLSGSSKKEDIYNQPDENNLPTYIMESIEMFKHCSLGND